MTLARMGRLFAADGRCFDVAVDHGLFGEGALISGIEDMEAVVRVLAAARPDAIQLSPGQAPLLQAIPGPDKPALVMRPTETGYYGVDGDVEKIVPLVRQAAELGADIIKADPTDDVADYGRVIQAAGGRPVLPRGGGRVPVD